MKVVIFYDDSMNDEVKKIESVVASYACDAISCNDKNISFLQSSTKKPNSILQDATHIIFLFNKTILTNINFAFFLGYALGKSIPALLVCDSTDVNLPSEWSGLFTQLDCQSFAKSFEIEVENFKRNEAQQIAKKRILEKGYALFNSNYVQAVKNNEVDVAKLFIDAGFSPSEPDDLGTPVLSLAVRERHTEMVELLLKEGALVDATSKDRNYTALMDAAQIGEKVIAEILLKSGANPNTQSKDGQTALILAVGRQDVAIIDLLLEAGSDYLMKDSMGMSALDYANLFRNAEILELFEKVQNK